MKITLTSYDIANRLYNDEYARWTWLGAQALADYLDDFDEMTDQETEFDLVAIRCDYTEYTVKALLEDYGDDLDDVDFLDEEEKVNEILLNFSEYIEVDQRDGTKTYIIRE